MDPAKCESELLFKEAAHGAALLRPDVVVRLGAASLSSLSPLCHNPPG